jgi:hypothetical protein
LSSKQNSIPQAIRLSIRESIFEWISNKFSQNAPIEHFILSNIAAVITLCIKFDYPELWPNAFSQVLEFQRFGNSGVDMVVKILNELELEVVVFNEERTTEEIVHNVIIKDHMRKTTTIQDICSFLCNWSIYYSEAIVVANNSSATTTNVAEHNDLKNNKVFLINSCERCLLCLSEFIGFNFLFSRNIYIIF